MSIKITNLAGLVKPYLFQNSLSIQDKYVKTFNLYYCTMLVYQVHWSLHYVLPIFLVLKRGSGHAQTDRNPKA